MSTSVKTESTRAVYAWPLLLCLVGVDYFSTLAYLPSIAVSAAGPLAPIAAAGVVLATFFLALPVYWYVVGRSSEGRGAAGLIEDAVPGWRGKLLVLTLLGFAAVDFVITRSLSLAVAAIHVIHNPHSGEWLSGTPVGSMCDRLDLWLPLDGWLRRLDEPQVAVTIALSLLSLVLWQLLKHGVSRAALYVTAAVLVGYLALTAVVIAAGGAHLCANGEIASRWMTNVMPGMNGPSLAEADSTWLWTLGGVAFWSFPQLALGLSGFEMIMTVAPIAGDGTTSVGRAQRTYRMRKLMFAAAVIMAIFLSGAVFIVTLLTPIEAMAPGGLAEHRALAYLAHGSPLAVGAGTGLSPILGDGFGMLYDVATVLILCLAGVSVTMSVQTLLPHYLNRLGMDVVWAGKVGVVLATLHAMVLLVTIGFEASPSSQQWAYATSVLVLLAGAAMAALLDLGRATRDGARRIMFVVASAAATGLFASMAVITAAVNYSGLAIAAAFVCAIVISSFVSRWVRSTELRFEGFRFADEFSRQRWEAMRREGVGVLAPHRPGHMPLSEKDAAVRRDFRISADTPITYVEAVVGDPSDFYQQPLMRIEREGAREVIRVSQCASVPHVLAAMALELCTESAAPEMIFGWSHESPLAANLHFLLLGEGNIPWLVKALVSQAASGAARTPRIVVG